MTITTVQKATTKSDSLRTTVPQWAVEQFELKPGDKLNWKMEALKGSLVLIVEPVKE